MKQTEYTESYTNLIHGTDKVSAEKIIANGFEIRGNDQSWCGKGVYFYDMKSKAWWSANRTCIELKKTTGKNLKSEVIYADIIDIPKKNVFDMRIDKNLEEFQKFTSGIFNDDYLGIEGITDETKRVIVLRSLMISFYTDRHKSKLVIGNFRQRPQIKHTNIIEFSNGLDIVFGVETIYCVKDMSILSNIHIKEEKI